MRKIDVDIINKLSGSLRKLPMRFAWLPSGSSQDVNSVDLENSIADLEKVRDDLSELLGRIAQENQELRAQIEQLKVDSSNEVLTAVEGKRLEIPNDLQHDQSQILCKEIDLYKQENRLILDNMFLTQEELERQLIEKDQLKVDCQLLANRLLRFSQHYPRTLDFLSIEVQSFDSVTSTPHFIGLVRNCHLGGVTFTQINFRVVLSAGLVGVEVLSALSDSSKSIKNVGLIFPGVATSSSVVKSSLAQIETSEQWLAHQATMMAIKYILDSGWKNIATPDGFDSNFWSGSMFKLVREFDSLPPVFRFDAVHLKQESINPDYEHLWLDILGVTFGDFAIPKLEIRLGAANVESTDFSRFPKIEIPLIDGSVKPFESWYAESFDDYGAKYELRFDLNKKRFDVGVWSKLSLNDRNLVYAWLASLPKILATVGKENKNLQRPIKSWFDFAVETKKVLYDYLKAAVKS
jgi:hypothetical protein